MSNPFAPPLTDVAPPVPGSEGLWRLDGGIVARKARNTWPRRCVKCNDEQVVDLPLLVAVEWVPGWVYLLLITGVLPYVIVRGNVRRRCPVRLYLCRAHHAQRVLWRVGTPIAAVAVSIAGMAITSVTDQAIGMLLPFAGILAVFWFPYGTVWAREIRGQRVDLRGAGAAFVATLPPWEEGTIDVLEYDDVGDVDA